MKTVALREADLDRCVKDAQCGRVLITRRGRPVALVVGVEGLDREQIELGQSNKFWKLIRKRRRERSISRSELEKRLRGD